MTTVQRSPRAPSSPRCATRLSSGGSGSTGPVSRPTRSWAFCMTASSCRRVKTLGDTDPAHWEEGLAGEPQDPWQHAQLLVLQDTRTSELFTFTTSSKTGRRAVGTLLKHYDRMQKTNPGELPVVRLRTGGFQHRDDRIGFVTTPVFVVCGRQPRDSVAKPDTSIGAYMNDEIPLWRGPGDESCRGRRCKCRRPSFRGGSYSCLTPTKTPCSVCAPRSSGSFGLSTGTSLPRRGAATGSGRRKISKYLSENLWTWPRRRRCRQGGASTSSSRFSARHPDAHAVLCTGHRRRVAPPAEVRCHDLYHHWLAQQWEGGAMLKLDKELGEEAH